MVFSWCFEPDKFLLTKNGMYVHKGYGDMFKFFVITMTPHDKDMNKLYAYLLESLNI